MTEIVQDDLSGRGTRELLTLHLAGMHANSPPGAVFALDLTGLQAADVTVWTVREGDEVLAIGALKALPGGLGEIKSMRTHPHQLRRGLAALLLEHIVAEATGRGMTRLSLETGRGDAFEPALRLYRRRGFKDGAAFGDYQPNEFSQYLHLALPAEPAPDARHGAGVKMVQKPTKRIAEC